MALSLLHATTSTDAAVTNSEILISKTSLNAKNNPRSDVDLREELRGGAYKEEPRARSQNPPKKIELKRPGSTRCWVHQEADLIIIQSGI